jgi:hypothetical protein
MPKVGINFAAVYLTGFLATVAVLLAGWSSGFDVGSGRWTEGAAIAGLGAIAWYIFFRCCRCVLR